MASAPRSRPRDPRARRWFLSGGLDSALSRPSGSLTSALLHEPGIFRAPARSRPWNGDLNWKAAVPVQSMWHEKSDARFPPATGQILAVAPIHLSLNYLSLVSEQERFREILKLYTSLSIAYAKQIEGILQIKAAPAFARYLCGKGSPSPRHAR